MSCALLSVVPLVLRAMGYPATAPDTFILHNNVVFLTLKSQHMNTKMVTNK